jgi:FMN phosphatase YigB (HAD superfamily)
MRVEIMIRYVIWDLGDTLVTPPDGGRDLQPLDLCQEIELRPGAREVLADVQDLGFIQAVLSNTAASDSEAARRLLQRLDVDSHFAYVLATQSELTRDKPQKPDAAVFHHVLGALGARAEEAVMVGNSWDNDVLGANASGLHALWLTNPVVSCRLDLITTVNAPPWIVPIWDLADVPDALRALNAVL